MTTGKNDIGIAQIFDSGKMFFNRKELSDEDKLKAARIVPICLGTLDLNKKVNMGYTEIKGVGWGNSYEEIPDFRKTGKRDPVYYRV